MRSQHGTFPAWKAPIHARGGRRRQRRNRAGKRMRASFFGAYKNCHFISRRAGAAGDAACEARPRADGWRDRHELAIGRALPASGIPMTDYLSAIFESPGLVIAYDNGK